MQRDKVGAGGARARLGCEGHLGLLGTALDRDPPEVPVVPPSMTPSPAAPFKVDIEKVNVGASWRGGGLLGHPGGGGGSR